MKKIVLILLVSSLLLAGCSALTGLNNQSVSDAEMATRVAQLLLTMTTPTTEIGFPNTPTPFATNDLITATPELITSTPAFVTSTPVVAGVITATPGGETDTAQPTETSVAVTDTPAATIAPSTAIPTATAQPVSATATATVTPPATDPALTLGNPTGTDTLDSASKWAWPTGDDDYLKVAFNNGHMQMTGLTNLAGWRLPLISQQVNTYIELTANSGSCTGKDSYGIIFRVPVLKDPTQGYLFEVTCDGYYRLWKWDGKVTPNGLATTLVAWRQSDAINAGANQTNRLGVMVKDNSYILYMNGVQLASAADSSYSAGFFGVFVHSAETSNYTVNFDTMKYWELP
jgi:hypothetical protein